MHKLIALLFLFAIASISHATDVKENIKKEDTHKKKKEKKQSDEKKSKKKKEKSKKKKEDLEPQMIFTLPPPENGENKEKQILKQGSLPPPSPIGLKKNEC